MRNIEFSNINETVLLLNTTIRFNEKDRRAININIPTIGEMLQEAHIHTFLGVINLTKEDIEKQHFNFVIEDRGDIAIGLMANDESYLTLLFTFFSKYVENLTQNDGFLYIDDVLITSAEIEYIIDVILVGTGYKHYSEISQEAMQAQKDEADRISKLTPLERKHEETQQRLAAAKARRAQKENDNSKGEPLTLDRIIVGVMHSFQYKTTDIKNLNYFGLYHLFGIIFKIDQYDIMKQLYANGNLDDKAKLTHWLN